MLWHIQNLVSPNKEQEQEEQITKQNPLHLWYVQIAEHLFNTIGFVQNVVFTKENLQLTKKKLLSHIFFYNFTDLYNQKS